MSSTPKKPAPGSTEEMKSWIDIVKKNWRAIIGGKDETPKPPAPPIER